jgi:hypothetical protein
VALFGKFYCGAALLQRGVFYCGAASLQRGAHCITPPPPPPPPPPCWGASPLARARIAARQLRKRGSARAFFLRRALWPGGCVIRVVGTALAVALFGSFYCGAASLQRGAHCIPPRRPERVPATRPLPWRCLENFTAGLPRCRAAPTELH